MKTRDLTKLVDTDEVVVLVHNRFGKVLATKRSRQKQSGWGTVSDGVLVLHTDEDGNPERRTLTQFASQGIAVHRVNDYKVRRHLHRPVMDDFGNVVTVLSNRQSIVRPAEVITTVTELRAERARAEADRKARAEEDRRRREVDAKERRFPLAYLTSLVGEKAAETIDNESYSADRLVSVTEAIEAAEVTEMAPNVYRVKLDVHPRFDVRVLVLGDEVIDLLRGQTGRVDVKVLAALVAHAPEVADDVARAAGWASEEVAA